MSTPNFYHGNASKIFSFFTEDDFSWQDQRDNIFCAVRERAKEAGLDFTDCRDNPAGTQSYPAEQVCMVSKYRTVGDIGVGVEITVIMRSGYYSGGSMDWELVTVIEGEEVADLVDVFKFYSDMNAGLRSIQAANADVWVVRQREEIIDLVEGVFGEYTDPLVCVGMFSNGEAVYEKAEK